LTTLEKGVIGEQKLRGKGGHCGAGNNKKRSHANLKRGDHRVLKRQTKKGCALGITKFENGDLS